MRGKMDRSRSSLRRSQTSLLTTITVEKNGAFRHQAHARECLYGNALCNKVTESGSRTSAGSS
jgi:hypothetical protein